MLISDTILLEKITGLLMRFIMMRRNLFLVVLLLLVFLALSCNRQSREKAESIFSLDSEKAKEKEDTLLEFAANYEDNVAEGSSIFSYYMGTYLPEIYIQALKDLKSHKKATQKFRDIDSDNPNVLFLNEKTLEGIVNFHEGWGEDILKYENGYFYTETSKGIKKYKLEDGETIIAGNTKYKKIDNNVSKIDDNIIRNYIVQTLFNEIHLNNGNASFKTENNKIIYNGVEYTYGTELVFTSLIYDSILAADYKSKYIEVIDNCINIYNAIIPEEELDDPFGILDASYELENSFTVMK